MNRINRRNFLKIGAAAGIGLAMPRGVYAQVSPPPPPTPNTAPPHMLEHKVTMADRQAAAANYRAAGYLPGAAARTMAPTPGGIPHYFGPFANYANSPMPVGPIASITVDNAGTGYTAATVDILDVYDTGSAATATASVVGGKVVSITVTNPGSGYTAPRVTITGDGVDAAATANLGALTGGIRKFMDSLAGLGPTAASTVSADSYIPIAGADTTTFPGCDYYEISLEEYEQQFHRDLPPTRLRGYRQTNGPTPDAKPHYLGPLILVNRGTPVRIKFTNNLPIDAGGNLFIPVDPSVMGAGMGPLDMPMMPGMPPMKESYTQNRATLHFHGGLIPWISDGTPHQWTTPAGEMTQYPKGVSVQYVPDMWFDAAGTVIPGASLTPPVAGATNNPGPGSLTFYYNNEQSARLMFYHDHAYGITRLNVYVGEAAAYVITDQVEQDLIAGTVTPINPLGLKVLPDIGIPLVIQDKTFVDPTTIGAQDPTWNWGVTPGTANKGDLWVPSVYMPAQNPYDVSGANAFGRWQYGPWFWPATTDITNGPVVNEYFGSAPWEPPMRPDSPTPSMGMEAFNDVTMVNGVCYPYVDLPAAPVRFRILNAANDRFFNLHFYEADPTVVTSDGRTNTEVKMVPALATPGFPPAWSTDGRVGGVPDPATMGPNWIQIGTEGGFLPEPVVIPPQPINWNMNATAFNFGNVTDHSLLLGCAERADVIVDFGPYAGKTLILYNDAPAAFPALDPRYDYYTGSPDLTDSGGIMTTHAGFAPNIRTIMQVRVGGVAAGTTLAAVSLRTGGADYSAAPTVVIEGGSDPLAVIPFTNATATATCSIDHITVNATGSGYGTTAPTVVIDPPPTGGTQAVATANLTNGRVTSITITDPGLGYLVAPAVTMAGGATATAALTVSAISLDIVGDGYVSTPTVTLEGGGGYGATAVASLVLLGGTYDLAGLMSVWAHDTATSKPGVFESVQDYPIIPQVGYNSSFGWSVVDNMDQYIQQQDWSKTFFPGPIPAIRLLTGGAGYSVKPTVVIDGVGTGATADATISPSFINAVTLTNGGAGYTSAPTAVFTGGAGTGATASVGFTRVVNSVTMVAQGSGYGPSVRISFFGGGGTGATAVAVLGAGGAITAINVTNRGSGYTSVPQVRITGGGGRNASATATITGIVSSLTLTNGGSGYTDPTTVSFIGGGTPTQDATATASVTLGFVSSVTLTNPGNGYTSLPTVSFSGGGGVTAVATAVVVPVTIDPLQPKAIHDEMGAAYDTTYGRMGGLLGLELPKVNSLNQNLVLYGYASPPVDLLKDSTAAQLGSLADGTEIWKITHNGVDTHPIHFHLVNVQLINRVAWDGAMLPPEPNEVGWKETVRVNPLEHCIVAMRPVVPPNLPFEVPNSIRLIDPTMPEGEILLGGPGGFIDPSGEIAGVVNHKVNYGWEYVWHCHILSHEEMDMMHSLSFGVAPAAPSNLVPTYFSSGPRRVRLTWTDNSKNETHFTIERSLTATGPWTLLSTLATPDGPGTGGTVTYNDSFQVLTNRTYYYRVSAVNIIGDTTVYPAPAVGYPNKRISSASVNMRITTNTNNPNPQPFIFASSFNGLGGWAGAVGNVAAGAVAGAMPMAAVDANEVMIATIDHDPTGEFALPAYVYDNSPDMEEMYYASFLFNPNDAVSGDGPVDIFVGLDQDFMPAFGVQYQRDEASNTLEVRGWFLADGQQVFTDMVEIANGANMIDMAWQSGAQGSFSLFLNEQHIKTMTGDTSAHKLVEVLLGPSMGLSKASSGVMYFDEFTSSRLVAGLSKKLFFGWLSK